MSRVLAVCAACLLLLCAGTALADIADSIEQLESSGATRVRLAAALSLGKSHDPRAVIALAGALRRDDDATIRRIAALSLAKMIDARTAPDAIDIGVTALSEASTSDTDAKTREVAGKAARTLAPLRKRGGVPPPRSDLPPVGNKPPVFVNVDATFDQSKQLPPGGGDRLMRIVKRNVEGTGYATSWPGGLPTSAELTSSRSRAFIVASTVKKIEITKLGSQTQIACTVAVRVAPWTGKDGGERWEANRAASASGSAKATTGNRATDIAGGVRDCVEAVAEDVTARQVIPFLKQLATSSI